MISLVRFPKLFYKCKACQPSQSFKCFFKFSSCHGSTCTRLCHSKRGLSFKSLGIYLNNPSILVKFALNSPEIKKWIYYFFKSKTTWGKSMSHYNLTFINSHVFLFNFTTNLLLPPPPTNPKMCNVNAWGEREFYKLSVSHGKFIPNFEFKTVSWKTSISENDITPVCFWFTIDYKS